MDKSKRKLSLETIFRRIKMIEINCDIISLLTRLIILTSLHLFVDCKIEESKRFLKNFTIFISIFEITRFTSFNV